MKKFLLAVFIILTLSANCYSQFSKTHYIPPVSNTGANGQDPQGQYMYISCPSLTPVSFTIQEIGGGSISGTVTRDNPYVHTIGFGYDTQLLIDSSEVGTIKNNKGYIVEASDLIYVTVRLTSSTSNFQGGGLVSKGIAKDRISGQGFGESEPKVTCDKCTEEEHSQNRRSEFLIVKK